MHTALATPATPGKTDATVATRPTASTFLAERQFLAGDVNKLETLFQHYPPLIRDDAVWLRFFCQAKCNGEHALLGKIARALGLKDRSGKEPTDQYWYQVVTGRYFKPGGDVAAFARYVGAFRGYARSLESSSSISHVNTKNWDLFSDYVDSRRTFSSSCRWGGVEGLSGSQKTQCGKHYAALHNHRETIHLESPARCTRARLVQKIAELYEIAESKNIGGKEIEIERFLKSASQVSAEGAERKPRTIILDNVQRLFRPGIQPDQQPIFNYLHELQDDTGCCLILTWVPSFTKTICSDHPFWAQFLGRIGGEDEILRLDQALPKKDLLAFAREFRVANEAGALPFLKKWAGTKWGVRVLMLKLEKARKLASARGAREITADHLNEIDLENTPPPADDQDEGGAV